MLVWNIRGIAGRASIRRLKKLLRLHSVTFLVIIEPMVDAGLLDDFTSRFGFHLRVCNSSNKIWVMWRSGFAVNVLVNNDQLIHMQVSHDSWNFVAHRSFVYGKCSRVERRALWSALGLISEEMETKSWLVGGDFNVVAAADEYAGQATQDLTAMAEFAECISACDLKEIPFSGSRYTWTGIRQGRRIWKRLDRLLMNLEWQRRFYGSVVKHLNRATSDHSPQLLQLSPGLPTGPKSFRFQDMWLNHHGFLMVVRQCWDQPTDGYGMFRFFLKLKRLKQALRTWNQDVFGNIFEKVSKAEEEVRLKELQLEKARVKWLREGDANTRYFHSHLLDKRARLSITRICNLEGEVVESADDIGTAAVAFFQSLLAEVLPINNIAICRLLEAIPPLVTPDQNAQLFQEITLEEVWQAVFELDGQSAAGCDGFSGNFYKRCWDIIAQDVLQTALEFMCDVPIPKGIVSTLILLLPKKEAPHSFANFRPISLCNFINKVFTKILSNCLKVVLPTIISLEQSGFVSGRDIADNILLAQELVNSIDKKAWVHNVIFKLDMMKAFDRVSQDFPSQLLLQFGFHSHFVSLIMNNLTSAWFSILVNGRPHGFFQAKQGLKQGDPLSPFLFILVSEALSRGVNNLALQRKLQPFALGSHCPTVSYLAFADDIVIFTRGDNRSVQSLMGFLELYQHGSGQRVNKDKSFYIVSPKCPLAAKRLLSRRTGFQYKGLPFVYLGCKLVKGKMRMEHFQPLIDRIQAKLVGWKNRLLSPGGRLILIKHVLSSIPIYTLAVSELPRGVIKRIEKLMSTFLWGEVEGRDKRHWRKWQALCKPTQENGLGLRRLQDVQDAFGCKLWWKMRTSDTLWTRFMRAKHVAVTEHLTTTPASQTSSAVWKRMLRVRDFVEEHSQTLIKNGSASFWYDNWIGSGPLGKHRLHVPSPNLYLRDVLHDNIWHLDQRLGFNLPSKCPYCDTLAHWFVECSLATQVWGKLEQLLDIRAPSHHDIILKLQGWWSNISGKSAMAKLSHIVPLFVCWELWKARSWAIFDATTPSATHVVRQILRLIHLMALAHPLSLACMNDDRLLKRGVVPFLKKAKSTQVLSLAWAPPPASYVKLNIDGSSSGNPGNSGGGIIRDQHGHVLSAFSSFYGFRTNMQAKAMAVLEGLHLCISFGMQYIKVELDSLVLLNVINGEHRCPWRIDEVIARARVALRQASFELTHCYRETNAAADSLAKRVVSSGDSKVFDALSLPTLTTGLCKLDSRQYPYIRYAIGVKSYKKSQNFKRLVIPKRAQARDRRTALKSRIAGPIPGATIILGRHILNLRVIRNLFKGDLWQQLKEEHREAILFGNKLGIGRLEFDPEIEKIVRTLMKETKLQKQQVSTAQPSGLEQNPDLSDSSVDLEANLLAPNKTMVAQRTLRKFATSNVNQQPLCITYIDTEEDFELKSGLIHLLPTFRRVAGEDPYKHFKEFHVVCSTMRLQGVTEEQIKLHVFPFSLADKAKDWLVYLPSGSITTWE
nr:uncharacterized protein LOC113693523 [Coffea arabica]